jgi:hypothetical protein
MGNDDLNVETINKLEAMGTCQLTHAEYASVKQVGPSIRGMEERAS